MSFTATVTILLILPMFALLFELICKHWQVVVNQIYLMMYDMIVLNFTHCFSCVAVRLSSDYRLLFCPTVNVFTSSA